MPALELEPTPEQQAVVDYPLAPLRVTAGAGTGKTTTMALRLASLVGSGALAPEEVLGITFTNKAAAELHDRIRQLLPDHAAEGRGVEVTTYHGFAHGLLREFGAAVGVERDAVVVTPGYARQLLRDALGAGRYEYVDVTHAPTRVDELATLAAQLGDNLLGPAALVGLLPDQTDEVPQKRRELAEALARYGDIKARLGAVDFSDLIRLAYELVERRPEIAAQVRHRYRAVLLDEYQDTNPAQRELLRRLFGDGFPITAVGDPDQTIYEWRGASRHNFAGFPGHFPNRDGSAAATLPLSLNRRSDRLILDLAGAVRAEIGDDEGIERLLPGPAAGKGSLAWGWFRTSVDEANRIAEEVRSLHDDEGVAWRDVAILFRKNAQIGLVRDALELAGVPVEVASLGGLMGVPEVAELHSWLRILGRADDSPALARILLGSRYRLGLGDLHSLSQWGRDRAEEAAEDGGRDRSTFTILEAVFDLDRCPGLTDTARERLVEFGRLYRELLETAQGVTLVEMCRRILDRTGAWPEVEAMESAARLSARLNLYRFLDLAEEWSPLEGRPSLDAFLDYLELLQEDRAAEELDTARLGGEDAVALLTVHRAKGLEWPVVFLPALCAGTFPSRPRRLEDPDRVPQILPEALRLDAEHLGSLPEDHRERREILQQRHRSQEWRTAYVAVTRARHRLYCTGAYWFTEREPRERSLLIDLVAAIPEAEVLADTAEPGDPPLALRFEAIGDDAPDPHFGDGWRAALERSVADPGWPAEHARSQGLDAAYHARVEQLRITLDGLPDPPPPDADDGTLRTSVTGLVTYATCPLRFRWSEVDRLPRRSSAAARRGVEVHRRIELHNRGRLAFEDADERFYDLPAGDDAGGDDAGAADAWEAFLSSRFAQSPPRLIETPFDLELDEARVRGRIDAIYEDEPGVWEIVDFKSGRPNADPALRVQLEAYAVAAHDVGFAPERPHRVLVTFAYLGGGVSEVTEEVTDDWMAAARTHLGELVAGAAAGEFPAAPSAACHGCDFLRFCEAGTAWVEAQAPTP